jgi:hypothetical protein
MSDQVSVRLAVVGGSQFRQELRQSAGDGARAMQQLGTATRGVSPAFVQMASSARQMFGTFAGGNSALMTFVASLSRAAIGGGAFGVVVGTMLSGVSALVPQLGQAGQKARDAAREMANLQGSIGAVNGAVSALEKVQRDYIRAIEAQGGASSAAATAVIANSKAEFEARKQVLMIELELLRIRRTEQATNLANIEAAFSAEAQSVIERERGYNSYLKTGMPEPTGFAKRRVMGTPPSTKLYDDFLAANKETRLAIQKMSAEVKLTDLAIKQTEEALKGTFADITAGDPGTTGSTDPGKGGKGGGGGQSAAEKMAAEAKKIFDGTRTAAERYAAEMAKLNELLRQGAIDQETYNRAAENLRAEFESSQKFMQGVSSQIKSSMEALFQSIVEGGKTAGEVVEQLGKKLLAMALQESVFRLFAMLMPGTFGAGGFIPLIGNANGNAFGGGRIIPFARGGVVSGPTLFPMRGATGMMGEAGPEAIMPLTRIAGKLGVAAAGGGAAQVDVQVNNYSGGDTTVTESRGPNGRRLLKVEIGKSMASGGQDDVMKSRFGIRPQRMRR